MKRELAISLFAGILGLVSLPLAQAQNNINAQGSNDNVSSASAQQEANEMVPAHAVLLNKVNARKSHAGDEIRAELRRTIQLKGGTTLPDGTVLTGTVTEDQASPDNVRVSLRFNEAKLKDGSTVPIKVMIVSIQTTQSIEDVGEDSSRVRTRDIWTPNTHKVDEIGVVSGADLHSSVTSENSAVISSTKKKDVTIDKGSEIDLVIAKE